jgi:hypothetical protein
VVSPTTTTAWVGLVSGGSPIKLDKTRLYVNY